MSAVHYSRWQRILRRLRYLNYVKKQRKARAKKKKQTAREEIRIHKNKIRRIRRQERLNERQKRKSERKAIQSEKIKARRIARKARQEELVNKSSSSLPGEASQKTLKLFVIIFFESLASYVLAFIIIFLLNQLIIFIAASSFDYPVQLSYYKVLFNMPRNEWTPEAVKIIFSAPLLFSFLLGFILFILYDRVKGLSGKLRLLLAWMLLHCLTFSLASLIAGCFIFYESGYAIAYLLLTETARLSISILAAFFMIVFIVVNFKNFITVANIYFEDFSNNNKWFILTSLYLLPAFLGAVVVNTLMHPHLNYYYFINTMALAITLISWVIMSIRPLFTEFSQSGIRAHISWKYIIILVLLITAYRTLL